jgi:carbon-monoxide dehydrogenase large subunit
MIASGPRLRHPVGARLPRARAKRLLQGKGRYTDDITLPRMVHVVFVRSPYAHAEILGIATDDAAAAPGVVAVATGADIAALCKPWTARHAVFPGLVTRQQYPMAIERACWQGEPVVAVVAESRSQAEDAAELVDIQWRELTAVTDPVRGLAPDSALVHPDLGSNLALETIVENGDAEGVFAAAEHVVEETYRFARHTGVCLEPRSIIADYDRGETSLTVYHSHQTPHNMQDNFSRLLGIPEQNVRVICPDVGGGFGIKQQLYADEIVACALSMSLGRPVKFIADRLESFVTDIHARDHQITGRMALSADGRILAMDIDDLFAIGAYSNYPRTSVGEGSIVLRVSGAPYRFSDYRARLRLVFQHKNIIGHYRGVGHPIANTVTEGLVDRAARELGLDPVEIRRRNLIADGGPPFETPAGIVLEDLAIHRCLDLLEQQVDVPAIRAEQAALRREGIYRGFGLSAYIDTTVPGPEYYGRAEARVTASDGCVVKLEPSGTVRCISSATDQGQGAEDCIRQIVAGTLGVPIDSVRVLTGDSATAPYGGGAWASRSAGIAGEAAFRATGTLRANVLDVAAQILQTKPDELDIVDGEIVDAASQSERLSLAALAAIAHFRQDTLPPGFQPQLLVAETYVPRDKPSLAANGVQASYLEVDTDTGMVTLLRHVVVHECGRAINPMTVDEQIRGGVVQGLGSALFEECVYDEAGQLLNGSLMDYLVPMAAEIPDIEVLHVEGELRDDTLAAKGAGEAGTSGAQGAVLNAINDALHPLQARVTEQPASPINILRALGKV